MISENTVKPSGNAKGMFLVLSAAMLWGGSGTSAQYLIQQHDFSTEWLVVARLLISGVLLLCFARAKDKCNIWAIWGNKNDMLNLLFFSILGVLAVQYTYFAAIKHSNAPTATVLQFLAPVLIFCYSAIRTKIIPTLYETLAVILALIGAFLLVTHGSIKGLSISGIALFWGLSSAFALAFYTLNPIKLLARWSSTLVVGWGMLVGGISFSFIHPPWVFQGQWSFGSLLATIFIIIFGTLIPFNFYLESLKYNSATETSLLACTEPLAVAVIAVIWLKVPFGFMDWLGTLCILGTIVILTLIKDKKTPSTGGDAPEMGCLTPLDAKV